MARYSPANGKARFGTKGQSVRDLQTSLNKAFTGQKGFTPLKVDGMFGPLTRSATQFKLPADKPAASIETNPALSGEEAKSDNDALGKDIEKRLDTSGLESSFSRSNRLLESRMADMERLYKQNVGGIKDNYEAAAGQQGKRQEKDAAGRATGLITSGGGFLGTTQSQEGVLQNLADTHEQESQALMAKRDAALQAAAEDYGSKAFQSAQQQLKLAKDTEQELYDRQREYASDKLAVSREQRSQQEFDAGFTDKKIEAYSSMSDSEFANVDTTETDKYYFDGYTANARSIAKSSNDIKTKKDRISLDSDILDMRLKMPLGQEFSLGDVTYKGLKQDKADTPSQSEREQNNLTFMRSNLFVEKDAEGNTVVIGDTSIPFINQETGYFTVAGFIEGLKKSGLSRDDFLDEFQGLLPVNAEDLEEFPLSNTDIKKLQGELPYRD